MDGICQCCKTTPIHSTNFDCGHIISEKNGGKVHLENLRPICRTCNSSMGTQNMDDYIVKMEPQPKGEDYYGQPSA